jgi:hypothetical protein
MEESLIVTDSRGSGVGLYILESSTNRRRHLLFWWIRWISVIPDLVREGIREYAGTYSPLFVQHSYTMKCVATGLDSNCLP